MEYLIPSELKFISDDNKVLGLKYLDKEYKAIKLKRCFPFNNPNKFICVNDSDSNEEIGIIEDLNVLDEETFKIVSEELEHRYFLPIITKITKVKEKRDFATLDIITNAGNKTITIQNIPFNINMFNNNQVIIKDVDGNMYEVDNNYLLSKDKNARFIKNYI